jgi:pimeloyl-ACP methyl ester carboxylesterase
MTAITARFCRPARHRGKPMCEHPRMPIARANGIEISFEDGGPADARPLLLINGFRSQLVGWDDLLLELLADEGFRLIRFDNRDVGLTSKTAGDQPTFVLRNGRYELDGPARTRWRTWRPTAWPCSTPSASRRPT